MYLRVGGYTHAFDETSIVIRKTKTTDAFGRNTLVEHVWNIAGRLHAATPAALSTALIALEAAYTANGKDVALLLNDGVTASAHQIVASQCIGGGPIFRELGYPVGTGAQYTTYRDFEVEIQATQFIAFGIAGALINFQDSLEVTGTGGPAFVIRRPRNGVPIRQQVSERTPITAVQSGSAEASTPYPNPASPLWPDSFKQDRATIGRRYGGGKYVTTWNYSFEAATTLSGNPRVG